VATPSSARRNRRSRCSLPDFAGPRWRPCLKAPPSRPSPPQMPMAACWKASPTKTRPPVDGAPRRGAAPGRQPTD
jgi:hypothetical protein